MPTSAVHDEHGWPWCITISFRQVQVQLFGSILSEITDVFNDLYLEGRLRFLDRRTFLLRHRIRVSVQPTVQLRKKSLHNFRLLGRDVASFSFRRTVIVEFVVTVLVCDQSMRVRANRSSFGVRNRRMPCG